MLSSTRRISQQESTRLWILTVCVVATLSGCFVTPALGAPAKLDAIAPPPQSPFPLETQPTQFSEAIAAALKSDIGVRNDGGKSHPSAVDSYGNPIETLKPIDTPDGRKVISAQGLQFEIPNYASGITEIKQPADDLLPPFIGEFNNNTNNYAKNYTDFSATQNQQNIIETNNYNMTKRSRGKEDNSTKDGTIDGEVNSGKRFNSVSHNDDEYNTFSDILNKSHRVEATILSDLDTDSKTNCSVNEYAKPKTSDLYRITVYKNGKSRNENRLEYDSGFIGTLVYKNKANFQQNENNKSHKHLHNEARPLIDSIIKAFTTNTVNINTTTSAPISLTSAPTHLNEPPYFTHLTKVNSIKHTLPDLTHNEKPHIKFNAPHPPSANQTELAIAQLISFSNNFYKKNVIKRAKRSPIPSSSSHRNALPPFSNGNFNYPNVPTDLATINRIAAKYHTPLPTLDPIAVAVPTDSIDGENSVPETAATALTTTTVDVENAQLVELKPSQSNLFSLSSQSSNLPSYILDLNDPDIDGPVEYMPAEDGSSLKVIAWDLLPPFQEEPKLITADSSVTPITHNTKVSLTSGHSVSAQGPSHGVSSEGSDAVVPQNNLPPGSGIQVTSSTIASTTRTTTPRTTRATTPHTTRPTTTRPTTTRPTTTRPRTTTTRRATTTTRLPITTTTRRAPTTKKTTSTTTTTPIPTQLSSKDFYQLEHGDSYTLPSWLADIDDPELDAAVTYIVPENIHEYNDTISRDILPPLEPYTDLNNIDLPAPEGLHTTTTTTNRPRTTAATSTTSEVYTSTSRSSTISTPRPHWVRAYPTTTPTTTTTSTQKPKSFNDRISSNHIALSHDSNSASSFISPNSKASTSFLGTTSTTTTTTESPRLTTAEPHHHIVNNRFNKNSPTITVDHTASNKIKDNKAIPTATFSNANPFLPAHNSGARPFATKSTDKFTGTSSTTTTTTTTTTAATPVEENPFDSATLPPWLADFDYPDLGPGVAFIYEAEDSNSDVSNDLLPPSQLTAEAADTTKPVFISSSPSSFNSFQISPSSTNRHETTFASASTSPTRTFTFNNFPSKVTTTVKPLSIQNTFAQVPNSNNNNYNQEAVTSPPVLFIPPNAEAESNIDTAAVNDISKSQLQPAATAGQTFSKKPSSSSFNKNFAAPFEPTTVPGSADSDQDFGSSTKTTFTKSDEGKVISNNIFGNNGGITAATKQFGLSTASSTTGQASLQKELQHSTFSGSLSTFNKAVTPGGFSSFTSTQQTNFNSAGSVKYTGGFGGAPGVLGSGKFGSAVNTDGSIRTATNLTFGQAPTAAPKQTTSPSFVSRIGIPATGVTATALGTGVNKYQGTFGGPPGVLTPFDSVKSG